MSNYSAGRGPRPADPYPTLRLAALIAVIAGVVLLAAAAFVLSYDGIHEIVLHAGVKPEFARFYPLMLDAMLVVAGAAALALRGAGWWPRAYAWSTLLILLAAIAVGDALHATSVTLPAKPTRAAVAVIPSVLLLLAFGLWLEILRHFRKMRAAGARGRGPGPQAIAGGPAGTGHGANGVIGNGDSGASQRTAVTSASSGGAGQRRLPPALSGLEALLGPKEGSPPAADPVSYGEETGYVHPESYLGPGDYPGGESQHTGAESQATGSPDVRLLPADAGKQPAKATPPAEASSSTAQAPSATEASAPEKAPPTAKAPTAGASPSGETSTSTEEPQPTAVNSPKRSDPAAPAGDDQAAPAEDRQAPAGDHQAAPAGSQVSPDSGSGTAPEEAASDPGPRLERLRSAPAPPGD